MKKLGIKAVVFLLLICISIPMIQVFAAGEAVSISMSAMGTAKQGNEIIVKITVAKPSQALAGIEFTMTYDPEFVTPVSTVNTEDGREMDALVTKMPDGWEQMCTYSKAESKYYFRFAMPDDGSSYLNTASGIVLEVPFKVNAPGVIFFNIASAEIIAVAADSSFTTLTGKGNELSVVAAGASEKFAVELGNNDAAPENGLYYLNIEATNLGDSEGIIGLEFALKYDKSVFKPYITQNDNYQMDAFMVSMPKNAWEQMCTLYESESKLVLRFAALHAESLTESEKLASGASMKISVPFIVIGAEGAVAKFTVDSVSALGVNNKSQKIVGRGDVKTVTVCKSNSPIPAWLYETKEGHLLYAAEKTSISVFLESLGSLYVTHDGKKVTEGYVKTGNVLTDGKNISLIIVVKGDVNGSGEVDMMDYILTKRAYFGTFKTTATQTYAITVTGGNEPSTMDYILIKRHYFGTFDLNK